MVKQLYHKLKNQELVCQAFSNKKVTVFERRVICEPIVPQLEHLFKGIFKTYERLKELGFTYYEGKVSIIAMEGEPDA